jgi:hypothetical protein
MRSFLGDVIMSSIMAPSERTLPAAADESVSGLKRRAGIATDPGALKLLMAGVEANNVRLREVDKASSRSASPRICMPTWRNFTRKTFRCSLYEAQDVLAGVDDVELIRLDIGWGAWFTETALRRPLYHDVSRRMVFANPGMKKVQLEKNYDIFVAVCSTYWDVPYINAIKRWKSHCQVSVCWIDEIWASQILDYKYWHGALSQFDYVFTGCRGTVDALSQVIGRPCYWIPGGIDALRFCPFPSTSNRGIDVYSIGRRYDAIHQALLNAPEPRRPFYVYDSHFGVALAEVRDHQQHRNLVANIAKRSRYFVVAPAKMDSLGETCGQVEVGYRYFEGAAAGAVLIGEVPDSDTFRELFGWPDAVIPIRRDGSDVMAVLSALDSDPEREAAIRVRNVKESLLHHDWVYRWKEIFRIAGIEPTERMVARERRLEQMAELVTY